MMLKKVPVEFVPPGVSPEEARRQRKRQRLGPSRQDVIILIVLVLLAIAFVTGVIWFLFFRGKTKTAHAQTVQPTVVSTAQLVTNLPAPARETSPDDMFMVRWKDGNLYERYDRIVPPASTPTQTPTPTPEQSLFTSPVVTPVAVAPTPTPMPTPTPEFDYVQIADNVTPADMYSYVSGWIVERDGRTPRPVAVELIMPNGSTMRYPRPNNTDVANGFYEFLVSPGAYTLRVLDGRFQEIYFTVGDTPTRHEFSFQYLGTRSITAARSNPWAKYSPASAALPGTSPVATPTPTASPHFAFTVYLPVVVKSEPVARIYLPLVMNMQYGGSVVLEK